MRETIALASTSLGTLICFLIPLVKSVKAKNKPTVLNKITASLQQLIAEAKSFTVYSGAKKEHATSKANGYALNNKILYNRQTVTDKAENREALNKRFNIGDETTRVNKYYIVTFTRI